MYKLVRVAQWSIALAMTCTSALGQSSDAARAAEAAAEVASWCRRSLDVAPVIAETISLPDPAAGGAPQPRSIAMSLSLSGGGYRAMLFHVGTLRRLNDAGLLPRLSVISSVSGGSVASAWLAFSWEKLQFDDADRAINFVEVIENPLRDLAHKTMDIPAALTGLLPFTSAASRQVAHYDEYLFHGLELSKIPPGLPVKNGTLRPRPLFIFNATNLQTGEPWQFRAIAMGGPITQWTDAGKTLLSEAVAASSGFPPVLSPLVLHPDAASTWRDCSDRRDNPYGIADAHEPGRVLPAADRDAYRKDVYLIDGGVRDNLGIAPLEAINRKRRFDNVAGSTVTLISDGGATTSFDASPSTNWLSQSMRLLNLLSDQPDEVRVSGLIRTGSARLRGYGWFGSDSDPVCDDSQPPKELDRARLRAALSTSDDAYAYWSIRRKPKLHRGFQCPENLDDWMTDEVHAMASIPTAFRAMDDAEVSRLINWGYVSTHHGLPYVDFAWPDARLRKRWLGPCAVPNEPMDIDKDGKAASARDVRCMRLVDIAPGY